MLRIYEKYLEVVDEYIKKCFNDQKPFIKCHFGCADCCKVGEYPFSRLEMEYLLEGFPKLDVAIQNKIREEIKSLLKLKANSNKEKRFLHKCPLLSDEDSCYLYQRRGIVCRTYGLASFEEHNGEKIIKFPECAKNGLNYSEVFSEKGIQIEKFKEFGVKSPIAHSLSLNFFEKDLLKGFQGLEFGEIRPLLDWFREK